MSIEGMDTKGQTFLILQGENQYGVLDMLMREFQKYLEKYSTYQVKRIDCTAEEGMQNMAAELSQVPACVFCLEGIGFELKLPDGRYLMQVLTDDFQVRVFGWILDSSFYHYSRLTCMTDKMKVAFVDENEAKNAQKEYGIPTATVHHFGIETNSRKPMKEREIDLLLSCSCQTFSQFKAEMQSMVPDPFDQSLIIKTAELMLADDALLNWEALEQALSFFQISVAGEDVEEELKIIEGWADKYYRVQQREQCILYLLQSGITITVCGRGWQQFKEEFGITDQIHILSENMPYEEVLNVMDRSKIVLNICPSYKEGIHERICTSMLRGAVCLTDSSNYLKENFTDGENILFFHWDSLEESLQRAAGYLGQDDWLQKIANNAYLIAKKTMTVENFTSQVLELMEQRE